MDQGGPKHVELTYVMNKTQSLENFVVPCWTAYVLAKILFLDVSNLENDDDTLRRNVEI